MGLKGTTVLRDKRRRLGLLVLVFAPLAGCASDGAITGADHRVVVPDVVGLGQERAAGVLRHAGLTVGGIQGILSSRTQAGHVVATNPSAGEPAVSGATVSLTVSSGEPPAGSSSTTPVDQASCRSGQVAYTDSTDTGSVCLKIGSTLSVNFVSSRGWSGYGAWSPSPPTISDNSVLQGRSYRRSAKKAVAVLGAVGPGTATVTAQFDVQCAPADTTPCTVPPAAFQVLTVTVVSS